MEDTMRNDGTGRLDPGELASLGVTTVMVAAPDMTGALFGRRIPAGSLRRVLESGVEVCTAALSWDVTQEPLVDQQWTGFHTGWHDMTLVPDLTTLRLLPWLPATALCLADVVEYPGGPLLEVAPRTVLRRQTERLAAMGLRALVATELEFYLYEGTPAELRRRGHRDLVPTTVVRSDFALGGTNHMEPFFDRVRRSLAEAGIEVESTQAEWGLGQWELGLDHGDPLSVADRHTVFKMAVRDIAAANGYTATFMARPRGDQPGSSCHIHISLVDGDDRPVFATEGAGLRSDPLGAMATAMREALAGMIDMAPDTMLFMAPNVNSYTRLAHPEFAGNGLQWGHDNRTTSFRVVGHSPSTMRIEHRLGGADLNPHLGVAAILAGVRHGLEAGLQPGPPTIGNGYEQTATGLPTDLADAAARFGRSLRCREAFGDGVVDHYREVARAEVRAARAAVTDWEIGRYFDSV